MRRIFMLFIVVAVSLVLAVPAEAQFARASLRGEVTDPDGAALPGVAVAVVNEASGYRRQTITGINGSYDFNGLTPGVYTVTFTLQGFTQVQQGGVRLAVGTESSLDATEGHGRVEAALGTDRDPR